MKFIELTLRTVACNTERVDAMATVIRALFIAFVIAQLISDCHALTHSRSANVLLTRITSSRRRLTTCKESPLDSRELTKIFGRMAAKSILLDIPGAGTPEMANCCHGGCDNCDFSHSFDNLSAGRAKWVPTYCTRTLIDGRSEKAPWANIFDSPENSELQESISKATFTKRLRDLPYAMTMGPGTSVPADEVPVDAALEAFWDILLSGLVETEDFDGNHGGDVQLDASKVSERIHTDNIFPPDNIPPQTSCVTFFT